MDQALFNKLCEVARSHNFPTPTLDEAKAMQRTLGSAKLQGLVSSAHEGQDTAITVLDKYGQACQILTSLRRCGYPGIELTAVLELIREHGIQRLSPTACDAVTGDSSARALLKRWITGAQGGSESAATRAHPTDVLPPEDADMPPLYDEQSRSPAPRQQVQRNVPVERAERTDDRSQHQQDTTRAVRQQQQEYADRQNRSSNVSYIKGQESSEDHHRQRDVTPVGNGQREFDQVNAYGSDMAIQFERSPTKDRLSTTINIKCAKAKPGGKTRQGCDWNGAIVLMMTPHEVQLVLAVLLGYLPKFRAAGHGPQNDKWFEVEETQEDYAGAIRFAVAQGKGASADRRRVNITPVDIGLCIGIFMRAARDQLKVDDALLLAAIKRSAVMYDKSEQARQQRSGGMRRAG